MTKAIWVWALLFAVAVSAGTAVARPDAWVQLTTTGAEARLITTSPVCPAILVDGRSRSMTQRAAPADAFANRVCAATLRSGDRDVAVDGVRLRAPLPRPARIAIIGDTGCRLKGQAVQHCNDPGAWPFARIAALAAARRPDLVIHVGDYYYREIPCANQNPACDGSPYGDKWETWKSELFTPAAPLLAAAPWVFARGNHEDCTRGGGGWFRLLDAAPVAKACPADSDTFVATLGGTRLLVLDSSDAQDFIAPPDRVAAIRARLSGVDTAGHGEPFWLVTHRPFWNAARFADLVGDGFITATLRQAVKGRDLSGISLVLSGHIHNFTSLSFGAARPSQLIVGAGGATLDLEDAPPPATGRARVDGLPADIFTRGGFGYFILDRRGADWVGRFYDTDDRARAECVVRVAGLSCRATKPG